MMDRIYDLAIVGGGINGAGIAADAAGRGLHVLLAEMGDLAGATSSQSSKLIHGGLRYLEHYEFRLVREALAEREVLLAKAPHIIWPLRFVLPHVTGMRPQALIRAGLALYDHLAERRAIPASSALDLTRDPAGRALKPELTHGFAYWDCWVDDARLVVLNARAAADHGATLLTRTKVTEIAAADGLWHVSLVSGDWSRVVRARAVVNAAGPWAGDVARQASAGAPAADVPKLKLVKGSHIVVPRIPGAEDAYLLQNGDNRVVFALPFEQDFTLIGTTDVPYSGDPRDAVISPEEEDYLLELAGRFFAKPLERDAIVWRYAGVRPLLDDGSADPSAVSRDYHLQLLEPPGLPPLVNVIGGKITTYRRLAEAVLAKLEPRLSMGPPWTAAAPLPGGDVGDAGIGGYLLDLARRRPGLSMPCLARLTRLYGTRTDVLLGSAREAADLGTDLGAGLTEREVGYLREREWAQTPDDVLWRRTKAGLHMTDEQRAQAAEQIARLL
jgi:glycerol-3-phosphate dehydrogenase